MSTYYTKQSGKKDVYGRRIVIVLTSPKVASLPWLGEGLINVCFFFPFFLIWFQFDFNETCSFLFSRNTLKT